MRYKAANWWRNCGEEVIAFLFSFFADYGPFNLKHDYK